MATSGGELTFTAVPVGLGLRMGNDRDGDTFFDQDEIDAGSDPADAGSLPQGPSPIPALAPAGVVIFLTMLLLFSWWWRRRRAE